MTSLLTQSSRRKDTITDRQLDNMETDKLQGQQGAMLSLKQKQKDQVQTIIKSVRQRLTATH